MTNTRNTPVEALERAFPLRVRRYRLRSGSGGEGRYRGGEGIERDLEVLEDVTVSLITERRVFPPWGLAGGGPGAVGENWLLPGGDEGRAQRLGDKCSFELKAGDVLRMYTRAEEDGVRLLAEQTIPSSSATGRTSRSEPPTRRRGERWVRGGVRPARRRWVPRPLRGHRPRSRPRLVDIGIPRWS